MEGGKQLAQYNGAQHETGNHFSNNLWLPQAIERSTQEFC
jgi:hypothetical protein